MILNRKDTETRLYPIKGNGRLHFRGTPPACWPKARSESDPCTDGLDEKASNPLPPKLQFGAVFFAF